MAPAKIWRKGAWQNISNNAVVRPRGGEIGCVGRPSADGLPVSEYEIHWEARLHLVGVDSFAALTLTFLVSHHNEAFALA